MSVGDIDDTSAKQGHAPRPVGLTVQQQAEIAELLTQQQRAIDDANRNLQRKQSELDKRAAHLNRLQHRLETESEALERRRRDIDEEQRLWKEKKRRQRLQLSTLRQAVLQERQEIQSTHKQLQLWEQNQRDRQAAAEQSVQEMAEVLAAKMAELDAQRQAAEASLAEATAQLQAETLRLEAEKEAWRQKQASAQTRWSQHQQAVHAEFERRELQLLEQERELQERKQKWDSKRRQEEVSLKTQRLKLTNALKTVEEEALRQQRIQREESRRRTLSLNDELARQRDRLNAEIDLRRSELEAVQRRLQTAKSERTRPSAAIDLAQLGVSTSGEATRPSPDAESLQLPSELEATMDRIADMVAVLERLASHAQLLADDLEAGTARLENDRRRLAEQRAALEARLAAAAAPGPFANAEREHLRQERERMERAFRKLAAAKAAFLTTYRRKMFELQQTQQTVQLHQQLLEGEKRAVHEMLSRQADRVRQQHLELEKQKLSVECRNRDLTTASFGVECRRAKLKLEYGLLLQQQFALLALQKELTASAGPELQRRVQAALSAALEARRNQDADAAAELEDLYQRLQQTVKDLRLEQLRLAVSGDASTSQSLLALRQQLADAQCESQERERESRLERQSWENERKAMLELIQQLSDQVERLAASLVAEESAPDQWRDVA